MRMNRRGQLIAVVMCLGFLMPSLSRGADTTREFVNSCVYGTMAGTLVGLASLAFTSQPGDNLQNIARGASLGLYAGILLGIYAVKSDSGSGEGPGSLQAPSHSQNISVPNLRKADTDVRVASLHPLLVPVGDPKRGVDGAQLGILFSF